MKITKKYISLLLCFSILISVGVYSAHDVSAAEKSVKILYNGCETDDITFDRSEKITVFAEAVGLESTAFQWQILYDAENSVWVNIYDRTSQNCEVSYALVKNMLDDASGAYIRCAVTSPTETVYSDAVGVIVNPDPENAPQVTAFSQTRYVATEEVPIQHSAVKASEGENSETEYITVTIKYLDISSLQGTEAAIYSPYTATIEKGTDFKQSVISPTFLGFAPYVDSNKDGVIDEKDESAATYVFNEENVTENIEIKVYYRPIEVNFAVKYYFQNINDDLYTERPALYHSGKAETGTIISNEYLMEHAGETTGFTKMYHIPESIAADGSTVFECYYDRNYYLIQFDLNGGYGVDPIYARYDTPFIVNDPIRHGYNFAGWKLIGVDTNGNGEWDDDLPAAAPSELVSKIPEYNYRYQAQWEKVDTTYTVVYWVDKDYIGSKIVGEKSGHYVSGKDDISSDLIPEAYRKYYEYDRADTDVLVEGDGSTAVNVYYTAKKYTLRFYYAATEGIGTDSDGDGYAETFDTVKIIGGSTYFFGASYPGDNVSDDLTLLNYNFSVYGGSLVGTVTKLPQLNTEGKRRLNNGDYTLGTLTSGKTSYHYIEFTAGYGQNISGLWPCSVFESATRTSIDGNTNGWKGDQAFVSAWNGEHHVYYSKHNDNQTIKGKYEKLDEQLLFAPEYADEATVSYLCFWENGAPGITWNVPELYVYKIWVQVLAGENTEGLTTVTYNGVKYKLIDSYDTCDNSNVNEQTKPSLEGYINVASNWSVANFDSSLYKEGYIVNFYYKQENNTFAMKNRSDYLVNMVNTGTSGGVPYATQLSSLNEVQNAVDKNFVPPYPSVLEENAYYFDGWYTTELCLPDTKIDIAAATMPSSGLILYANWVPKTHTVRFFSTYDEMRGFENGTSSIMHHLAGVKHGETVGTVKNPARTGGGELDLTFAGWFYMENGQKKAYSPLNMPISRDVNIFAEWSSHSPQPFHISYVLRSEHDTKVADDTKGFAYGGTTRTFNAKAGNPYNQLYDKYNIGYFPTLSSHSITIQAEADKDNPEHNVHTFYYVKADNISYTVRYVNKETNMVMDQETYSTQSAVVTERFKAYENMVPDAFYKRLVLEVEENEKGEWVGTENNVITFYYTTNRTNAYYAVHFMLEKLDISETERENYSIDGTGGYEETGTHIEGVGKIGSTLYIAPQKISGFSLIQNTAVPIIVSNGAQSTATYSAANGGYGVTVTQQGTELYLFYKRNDYPYKVHYYEYNTTDSLAESKNGGANFGSTVSETAQKIDGYTCVSEQTQSIIMREDDGIKDMNVIIFYYAPLQYVAEYVAVTDDGGRLSNTIEVITGSEPLKGSVPTANRYYIFGGWYTDAECTQPVTEAEGTFDSASNRFTPKKSSLSETERNIFYAKFIKKVGDFTVDRNGAADKNQVFVYEIKDEDKGTVYCVTVKGNGSAVIRDLPFGKYTVTQQNDWSWRYDDQRQSAVTHENGDGTIVLFGKSEQKQYWLNGNSEITKNQRK